MAAKEFAAKYPLSTGKLLRGLDDLRDRKLLCDVHLVAEDESFPAHRVVLAAASPYFQAMFTGGFKENELNEILLKDTSSKGLKYVLDAIYSAELLLSEDNVSDVLPVASHFQLNEIVNFSETFLCSNVGVHNCLSFLSVAEKYELQEAVEQCNFFVLNNFDVVAQSTKFLDISREQFCSYISDDRLRASKGEIEVYKATLRWFEANQSADAKFDEDSSDLVDLMSNVRFPLISIDSLLDEVLGSQLVYENSRIMKMVTEALRFHSNDYIYSQALQEGKQFQPRGEQKLVLIPCGTRDAGYSVKEKDTKLHMFNITDTDPFPSLYSTHSLPMAFVFRSVSVTTKGNYLFLFGADTEYFKPMALRFDIKTNAWLDLKSPPCKASAGQAAAILHNNIYLLGGMHVTRESLTMDSTCFSTCVLKYSIEENSWSRLKDLPLCVAYQSAASCGGYIFSAGGFVGTSTTDKLFAYDVAGNVWLTKASMNCKRAMLGMEVIGKKVIVACGGLSQPTAANNVEWYDTTQDQWTMVQNAVLDHCLSPGTVAMNDVIYVIGGSILENDLSRTGTDSVSRVDVENGTVDKMSSITFSGSCHVCAILTVPNNTPHASQADSDS